MPRISAIAAMSDNRVIGRENSLPWHVPEDLKHFKETTRGKPIIMGRKTFESMGSKPLPGRKNIILTRRKDFAAPGTSVAWTLDAALEMANAENPDEIFIGGGEEIYRLAMPKTDRIYLTVIHTEVEGDAHFPEVDLHKEFKVVSETDHQSTGPGNLSFTIITADRR